MEMLKENAKHYWEVITGGSKPKFKVGDRVLLALHPCVVNKVEWRGDSKYVGYVYTVRGTDFGKKVKEADLMLDPRKEETKSHNNMCKQLIDEMNPNVEVNVKTKPEPKFKVGDKITKGKTQLTILNILFDKYIVEDNFGECSILYFNSQDGRKIIKEEEITTIDKAAEVFAEMLVELCPELLGFGGAAKEWENEFRKRLEEQRI